MSDHNLAEALRQIINQAKWGTLERCEQLAREALAAHEAEQQAGEAVAWLVIDSTGQPMHAAGWEAAAHEHINDAISEYDLREAAEWRVVPVYTHPQQPLTEEQIRLERKRIDPMAEDMDAWSFGQGVRFAERALGITKDTK